MLSNLHPEFLEVVIKGSQEVEAEGLDPYDFFYMSPAMVCYELMRSPLKRAIVYSEELGAFIKKSSGKTVRIVNIEKGEDSD